MKKNGQKISGKSVLILAVNLLVMTAALIWIFHAKRNLPKVSLSVSDWRMEHMIYRDSALFLDDDVKNSGEWVPLLWGPYKSLERGSYTAKIEYTAEEDLRCQASALDYESRFVKSSEGILSKYLDSITYQFEVTENIENFELQIFYDGTGDFSIRSLSIHANNDRAERQAVKLILMMFLCDFVLYAAGLSRDKKFVIAALSGTILMISLPLAMPGIHDGHDLLVHLLRIEAIMQSLRSGQFPARISSLILHGLGYPFSIYYNDLFLYVPAFFRLCGFSVTEAYKNYIVFVNILTVLISWYSFRNIFEDKKTGLFLTLLYSTASYHFTNTFIRAAVGEYTAQAFLPLLALAIYRIFFRDAKSFRGIFRNGLILAVSMSGIIGSNVPSMFMSCFVLLLVCLRFLKKVFSKQVFFALMTGSFLTMLLNLYYLVPFLDYYINVPTNIKAQVDNDVFLIQARGAHLIQFFSFSQSAAGVADSPVSGRMQLSPGLPLMFVLLVGVLYILFRKTGKSFRFAAAFSVLSLFLASDIFPWDWLTLHLPLWNAMTGGVQFPWRFLVFAVLFLTLLAGEIISIREKPVPYNFLVPCTVVFFFFLCGDFLNQSDIIHYWDTSGIPLDAVGSQQLYLLEGSDPKKTSRAILSENMTEARILSRRSNGMRVYCKTSEDGDHSVTIPLYNYKGYTVTDMDRNSIPIINGDRNLIRFRLPNDFDGELSVIFKDPLSWRTALMISALSVVFLTVWLFLAHKRQRNHSIPRNS